MCIHTLYIFTLCTHHAFSRFPTRPCETQADHMRSLAIAPTNPSPRCTARRAHPFTARLVHALCSRCYHLQNPTITTFASIPRAHSPSSSTDIWAELAARKAIPLPDLTPDDPDNPDDGVLDFELAREAHPCIPPIAVSDWKWRATLTGPTPADPGAAAASGPGPGPPTRADRFSMYRSSTASSLRSASVASTASSSLSMSMGPGSLSRRGTDASSVTTASSVSSASSASISSGGGGGMFSRRKRGSSADGKDKEKDKLREKNAGLRELVLGTEGAAVVRVGRGMR